MTGVSMTKQQRCSGKKDVLIDSCSESCQGKKIVSSKVSQSRSRKFLHKKETSEKHNFHKYLYQVKTSVNAKVADCQPATLLKMNFFIGMNFLTANFRTPIFQNISQVAASAEEYSGPCETSKMELFCEYN